MKHKRTKRTIDPLHICGNAANLEYRTIIKSENLFCFVLQIGCIPTDVQGVCRTKNKKEKEKRKKERKKGSSITCFIIIDVRGILHGWGRLITSRTIALEIWWTYG